ncbi:MAG: hypothetical protein KH282_08025 [Clostridiales bacterium]|nr:hypothetical protein [Clostridiales bacterium]
MTDITKVHRYDLPDALCAEMQTALRPVLQNGRFETFMHSEEYTARPFEEQALLIAFYYLGLLEKRGSLPGRVAQETRMGLARSVARYAGDMRYQREMNKRQIALALPTDAMRTQLHKELNAGSPQALTTALQLLDIYSGDVFSKCWKGGQDARTGHESLQ